MLEEFFEAVSKQAVLAFGPKVVQPPAEPAHVYHLAVPNGTITRHEAQPKPRDHRASNLGAVVEFATRFKDQGACVWFHRTKVQAVLVDDSRRDSVTLDLRCTKPMLELLRQEGRPESFNQRQLILLLRTVFADCGPAVPDLIEVLRRVKFDNGQVVDSRVEHAKSSLGQNIRSEVVGTKAIPEQVVLEVQVFENGPGMPKAMVKLAVEPNAQTGTFQLIPLAGQLEDALALAEQEIGNLLAELLKDTGVPSYYGLA